MTKKCQITGKRTVAGNNVSHAHNKTKRTFKPNLHKHKVWSDEQRRWFTLKLSNRALRIIDKIGVDAALKRSS